MEATSPQTQALQERRVGDRRQTEQRPLSSARSKQSLPFAILNAVFIVGLQLLIIFIFCS